MYDFAVTFSELSVNLMIPETCSSCFRIKINISITATCESKRIHEKLDFCFSKNAIADIVSFDL